MKKLQKLLQLALRKVFVSFLILSLLAFLFLKITPQKAFASELFNITHDANNLNEYDSTVTDGGDLSTGTPGLAGTTAKMEALIDDTNAIYGEKNLSGTSHNLRLRFYIDPNSLTMADGDSFYFGKLTVSGDPWTISLWRMRKSGSSYQIQLMVDIDGGGSAQGAWRTITDAPHFIEMDYAGAATDVSVDGVFRVWIDGVLTDTLSNLDAYDIFDIGLNSVIVGPYYGIDAGTLGTFYLDELKANDDGSEIGGIPDTPTIDNFNDGSWTTDNTPTLQFDLSDPDSNDTVHYQLQIDDNSDFSSTVVNVTEGSGSTEPRSNVQ